jgi:hypothetical protein
MAAARRFKSWNILDSALIKNANGHHYWENRGLADELLRRGETVRLISHRDAPTAEEFPGVPIVPVFSLFLYESVSKDRTWKKLENFVVHNRAFAQDLARLNPALFEDSLALFPMVGDGQLLGIVRWLSSFRGANGPRAAACLIAPWEWTRTDHSTGLYKTLWKDCPPDVKDRIAIFGRTPQNAEMFAQHVGMPAHVYPYPIPEGLAEARPSPERKAHDGIVVSFVGGARKHRGGEFIADVVRQCGGSGVRFFIQARHGQDSDIDEQKLIALSDLPYVRVHEGPLERRDYYREIANSVVLLAYHPAAYRFRDSGVYHEAICLDAPVLVSAGTWMADEVAAAGNGLVIDDISIEGIVDCIMRAKRELPALRAAAIRVGAAERERHGMARCIDAIAAAFENPGDM